LSLVVKVPSQEEEGIGIFEIFCLLENNLFLAFDSIYTLKSFSGLELHILASHGAAGIRLDEKSPLLILRTELECSKQ
jgi:hypothetical protein